MFQKMFARILPEAASDILDGCVRGHVEDGVIVR
jgi:hypothetical protein